jgi:hypothetical protein
MIFMCWPCDGVTTVDTDRWGTSEGLPGITGFGTTKDAKYTKKVGGA